MKNPGYAPLLLVRSTRVVIRRAKTPQTRGKDSGTVGLDSSPLVYLTDSRGAIFRSNSWDTPSTNSGYPLLVDFIDLTGIIYSTCTITYLLFPFACTQPHYSLPSHHLSFCPFRFSSTLLHTHRSLPITSPSPSILFLAFLHRSLR